MFQEFRARTSPRSGIPRYGEHCDPVHVLIPSVGTCFLPVFLVIAKGFFHQPACDQHGPMEHCPGRFENAGIQRGTSCPRWFWCRHNRNVRQATAILYFAEFDGDSHISSRVIPTIAGTNTNHFRNVGPATTARCRLQGEQARGDDGNPQCLTSSPRTLSSSFETFHQHSQLAIPGFQVL